MSEQRPGPRPLVLDTSVAVKWHLPEEDHDVALGLLATVEEGAAELLAPSTIAPEFFNALWQQHRRSGMPVERIRIIWEDFAEAPVSFFGIDPFVHRAVEIALTTGVIVYDALFLALAEDAGTVVITADGRLLRSLEDTSYARLAHPLADIGSLLSVPG